MKLVKFWSKYGAQNLLPYVTNYHDSSTILPQTITILPFWRHIVENFDNNVSLAKQSSDHTHRSNEADEAIILSDLRQIKPFMLSPGRKYKSFSNIDADNLKSLNRADFTTWLLQRKKNLLLNAPLQLDGDNEQDQEDDEQDLDDENNLTI